MVTYIRGANEMNRVNMVERMNIMNISDIKEALANFAISLSRHNGMVTNIVAMATT